MADFMSNNLFNELLHLILQKKHWRETVRNATVTHSPCVVVVSTCRHNGVQDAICTG